MCIETIGNLSLEKTCMEPKNEVDKYAVAVSDNEKNVIGHLRNEKTIFYSLKTNPSNICHVKITRNAVNMRGNKGMRKLSTKIHWEL